MVIDDISLLDHRTFSMRIRRFSSFFFFLLIFHRISFVNGCSCQLDGTGMTMICEQIHTLNSYQQCMHEQLNHQSDVKLRRGGLITNLTIRNHQLKTISNGLLQFSYANILYQLNDLRYLHVINGTLKHIDQRALALVEQALEHFDVSFNELQQMPRISDDVEQHTNLV